MPLALVTNDDGIDGPGLVVLARAAVEAGFEVVVAAPAQDASGAGASIISVRRDGRTAVHERELPGLPGVRAYAVEAQPAFIVVAALHGWLDPAPDIVLSGVNLGANTGQAVLYSGTVGAALSAGVAGTTALAVSLAVPFSPPGVPRWEAVDGVLPEVLGLLDGTPAGTVLSLNVPNRAPVEQGPLRGARLARFGTVRARVDVVENGHLRLGASELDGDEALEAGTDVALLAAGHPTLTALRSVDEEPGTLVAERLSADRA